MKRINLLRGNEFGNAFPIWTPGTNFSFVHTTSFLLMSYVKHQRLNERCISRSCGFATHHWGAKSHFCCILMQVLQPLCLVFVTQLRCKNDCFANGGVAHLHSNLQSKLRCK